jgi:3-hydroxyacyl-CoA dehydrogenase/enoyl-CoA hydratase/3-hydroxybutyryl-CoA epimerase
MRYRLLALGLVDELASDLEQARARAAAWLATKPAATQPWERPGAALPAPAPGSAEARDLALGASARLVKRTAGALTAPQVALNAVVEGTRLAFDAGLAVEAAWFVRQVTSPEARAMLRTLWFHKRAAERHDGLPRTDHAAVRRVAVLGAGMMGAGLAYLAASRGFDVVLKDVSDAALARAREHVRAQAEARAGKGG